MIHFGTGGWRAVIGDGFTRENLQIIAQAMSRKMKDELCADEGMMIGYDRRFLSKEAMQWLAEVFAANGIETWLINKSCPTPVVMYLVQKEKRHYGMMVPASHNPAIYNGIKVFTSGGRDADVTVTRNIERYAEAVKTPVAYMEYREALAKGLVHEIYPINDYIDFILGDIDREAIRDAHLRLALDPMYGVSETAIKTIMITCRAEVETIHGGHDALFGGHMPAPEKMLMQELSAFVTMRGCDLGIATDGDADRIGIIDDKGRYLDANAVMLILYWYLVTFRGLKGPVVRNLCTTHALDRLAESFGEKCYEVPVGFKWVSAEMERTHAVIGGESSGGMAITGRTRGKDGVYAAALLVEMIARTGRKISEIYDDLWNQYGHSVFMADNYSFRPELKDAFMNRIMTEKQLPELPYETDHVSYMDGCKVYFKNGGWVSVRFSGTEPLLRIFCELPEGEDTAEVSRIWRDFLGIA